MNFSIFENLNRDIIANILFITLAIWSTAWKGFALWHTVESKERNWFIAILFLNTAGLLEIAYLFFFAKNKLTIKQVRTRINTIYKK